MTNISSKLSYFFFYVIAIFVSHDLSFQEIIETTPLKTLEQYIIENKYSNPDLAKSYANILLEKCKKKDNNHYHLTSLNQLGGIANIQGNYNDAISYSNRAILLSKKNKNKTHLFEALLTRGNAYLQLGNDKEALLNYMEASNIAKELKDVILTIRVSENIAKIKERIGQYEDALKTYRNNLKLTRKVKKNTVLVINTLMGIGRIYLKTNKPDSTLHYSEMGLEISKNINNLELASYFYNDIGKAYFKKELFDEAITYLKKSEALIIQLNNKTRLAETCYFIGHSYYKLKDMENTIISLKNVEKTVNKQRDSFNNNFNPPELILAYKLIAKAYKAQNKNHEAALYIQKYIALDDYNDLSKNKVVKELFDLKEDELQSSLILTFNEKNKVRYLLIIIGIIILLCLLLCIKFIREKKKNILAFQKLLKTTENVKPIKKEHELNIKDEKAVSILKGLDKLEQTNYFLNTDCSLSSMAKKLKTNTSYLSKVIHEYKQKNFYQYLNGLRIHYVLQRLKDDRKFRNYSVECISQEVGYKSTNSFTKHFKAHTKLYPSYYIKNLNKSEGN